jgi:hypothetical protein
MSASRHLARCPGGSFSLVIAVMIVARAVNTPT